MIQDSHYDIAFDLEKVVCGNEYEVKRLRTQVTNDPEVDGYVGVRIEHEQLVAVFEVHPNSKLNINYIRKTFCWKEYKVPQNVLKTIIDADWFYKKYNISTIRATASHSPYHNVWGHYVFAREGFDGELPSSLGFDWLVRAMRAYDEFDDPYTAITTLRQVHETGPMTVQRVVKALGLQFWKKHGLCLDVSYKVGG